MLEMYGVYGVYGVNSRLSNQKSEKVRERGAAGSGAASGAGDTGTPIGVSAAHSAQRTPLLVASRFFARSRAAFQSDCHCLPPVIVLDESYWAGSKRDKGKLRNLVTEDTHDIRLMHTNPYTEDSYIRIWFLSNDIHLVPFDEGERRFKCFNLLNEYAGIENERTKAYFKPLWVHPPEVFAMFLYHHDIRGWSPREFDIGVAGQEQMMATLRGVQLWWKSRLDDGVVAVEKQDRYADSQHNAKVPHRRSWPFGGLPIPKTVLYEDYHRFCKGNRVAGTAEIDSTAFKQLYQLVPKLESKTFTARDNYAQQDAQRPKCLLFPTLRECRDAWRQKYGDVDTDGWDDDIDNDKVTGGGRYEEPSWMAI
eukprot:COSAG03_NODE_3901_length_1767_cov_1.408273_2_plen_365_part_00